MDHVRLGLISRDRLYLANCCSSYDEYLELKQVFIGIVLDAYDTKKIVDVMFRVPKLSVQDLEAVQEVREDVFESVQEGIEESIGF